MELAELGKQPIRPDQPAGDDVRYDPQYEELQAEVDKFSSPSASGAVDWDKVVKLSSDILSQKSKDLLVASYLAVALIQTKKFEGVEIGSRIYRDLIEGHWDALFPTKARMRGRVAAIEWWAEKAESVLEQLPKGPFAEERINALEREPPEGRSASVGVLSRRRRRSGLSSISSALSRRSLLRRNRRPPNRSRPPRPRGPRKGASGRWARNRPSRARRRGPSRSPPPRRRMTVLEKALGDIARVAEYLPRREPVEPDGVSVLPGWRRGAPWSPSRPRRTGGRTFPRPTPPIPFAGSSGKGRTKAS